VLTPEQVKMRKAASASQSDMVDDADVHDRKILYECENAETASYIVAKI